MNRTDAPQKKPVAFGVNGQREALPDTTPSGDNTASYDVGFPSVTMILKSAGGLPPKGQDMNQILYELSLNSRWAQAGGGYQYDSVFSTAVSGYPLGAIVNNSTGDGCWLNTVDGNTNNPETATVTPLTGWIPVDSYGYTTKSGLTNASVTLTTLEASKDRIILTGALTANINVIVPAWRKKWTVINNCTGAFTVTVKTTSGTGVAIASGIHTPVYGDGTNILSDSDTSASLGRLIPVPVLFASSGIYNPSPGTAFIKVEMVGAGAASGGIYATSSTQGCIAAPGGNGAYAEAVITDGFTGVTVTIGTGGSGTANTGNNGGTSSFGSLLTCPGGNGSSGGALGAFPLYAILSTQTSSPTGGANTTITKSVYEYGNQVPLQISSGVSTNYSSIPTPLGNYGRGGAGQFNTVSSSAKNGISGNNGYCIVWEYK